MNQTPRRHSNAAEGFVHLNQDTSRVRFMPVDGDEDRTRLIFFYEPAPVGVHPLPQTAAAQMATLTRVLTWLISQNEFTGHRFNGGSVEETIRVFQFPPLETFNVGHYKDDNPTDGAS